MTDEDLAGMTGSEIAIVGMAGRFPGARTPDELWRNVRDGIESIRALSDDELRAAGVPAALLGDPSYVKAAPVLDEVGMFDAAFFGFNPKEAAIMDPQHRLFLECAWEALEHAGYAPGAAPGSVGVFAGCGMQAYMMYNLLANRSLMDSTGLFLVRHTGNDKDFLATRVSYCLNLTGPSINVQTACSTSLVAIHMASQSLLNGECDMALAGGVTIEVPHGHGYVYEEGEILSPDGHCRAFDAESRGTVFGSGAGVVVLKRLADARAAGDVVHAIIRGSAVNNDGSTKVGYLAPSVDGQAAAIAEAIAVAGVEAESISYVETHGTGTPVGDPIEVAALTQAFGASTARTGFCAIGSLKTNIGHLDTAAGVASIIKTVQALKHRQLPPSLHYRTPNPAIDFERTPFYVNASLADWRASGTPRRAGVSSLGVGGTNAHIVLEEAPAAEPSGPSRGWQLLALSARTKPALEHATARLAAHLREHPELPLPDVAHTLQTGRQALRERRVVVCRTDADAAAALESADPMRGATLTAPDAARPVAFMFAGGGAQYPTMGAELYRDEPVYRAAMDECLTLLRTREGLDLAPLLYPAGGATPELTARLERPSVALPALFATQYAQARLWMSWGIRPTAMIGHSMGEYTAAHLAGVFSLADAIALVTLRGRLFETLPEGAMLSVPMSEAELRELLPPELSIAAVNAPGLCVASGPVDAIAALERRLAARDVDTRRVRIAVAAHSAMLAPILDEFGTFFRRIAMRPPAIPFVSNLSGGWITAAEATDPGYWVRHLRSTVRFADGVRELMRENDRILLEVGPGRTLATLAKLQLGKSAQLVQSSMRHPDDDDSDVAFQLGALGRLWAAGASVEWAGFRGDERRLRAPLPTYPFERQRHWIDAEARPEARAPRAGAADGRADLGDWFSVPSWTRKPARQAAAAEIAEGAAVLLLADAEGIGDRLAARMRARGQHVTVVRAGSAFERRSDGDLVVNPRAPEDFEGLVAALAAQGDLPRRIVHCWNVGSDAAGEPLDRLAREEAHGFYSLLFLAQALGREDALDGVELDVLSTGMQRIAGERWLAPAKALLLGPCRVLPQEFEGLRCRSIDFALPDGVDAWRADAVVERLLAELDATDAEPVVAYRGRDRWVPSYEPTPLADAPGDAVPLRERGVYLITGGLGGMGLTIAEHLARAVRARLVLVGRSALPAREEWSRWLATHDAGDRTSVVLRQLLALESLGAEVMVASADVTDRASMARVVSRARDRFGAIHGVVHAAGVLDDGLAQLKSPESAARVLAPKVRGTLVLEETLGHEPLDFFALCSSISAVAGLAGQVDYAAANAFLDAFAGARAERSAGLTIALGWSAWRDVGMAAALAGGAGAVPGAESGAHPLIGRRLFSMSDEAVFATEMGVDTHWLLAEHRIRDGHALIPGTGHLEIARAAFEHGTLPSALELRDVAFLSPFVVHDGERKELRVHLRREGAQSRFVIAGRIGDGQDGGWEEHVVGTAARSDAAAPRTLDLAAVRARCGVREEVFDGGEESAHLAFGPRWKNLRRVCYGAREALATLEIPPEFADDLATFRLHPSVLDMATACAQSLIEGFDARRDFYVPLSYGRVRASGALPARVHSHIRLREGDLDPREIAVFDVTIVDDAGVEIVDIAEFMMRRVDGRDQMSDDGSTRAHPARRSTVRFDPPAARPASPVVPGLEYAIAPAEGVEAFRRILAAAPGPQVLISPEPVESAIARLRAPVPRAPAANGDAAGVADVDVPAIEEALVSHDAVREAAVLARPDRAGEVRLVAYVVYDAAEHVTVSDLRRYLKERLPDSSVPSNFVGVDAMPVTADGAVDRGALPDPFGAADDYVAPVTEMEQLIAGIWKEVLGIERVSRHDNFFDIGGHSLLAVRVVTRIDKRVGVRLSQAIMVLQTLEQIAAECEKRRQPADQAAPVAAPDTIGRKLLNVFKQSVMQS